MSLDSYRQKLKDEEATRNQGNFAVEKTIKPDLPNIIRLVDPESAVEYFESWMVCDDGERRPFIVENAHQGVGALGRLLGDRKNFYRDGILDSRLDEYKQKYYYWEKEDPELILQVAYNNDKSGDSGSWKPSRKYAFNCIDREPETEGDIVGQNWCVVNKHTKLLKMGATGLTSLLDVRDNDGNLEAYDINYKRTGKGMKNTKHNVMKAGDNLPFVALGPLTEEEMKYERYDLKVECGLSPAVYILKYLSITIERIDAVMGTSYLEEIKESMTMENGSDAQVQPETTPVQKITTPTQQSVVKPEQRTVQPPQDIRSNPTSNAVKPTNGQPPQPREIPQTKRREVIDNVGTVKCPLCNGDTPDSDVCAICGGVIKEPCPKCGFSFSIASDICPNCKQQFKLK